MSPMSRVLVVSTLLFVIASPALAKTSDGAAGTVYVTPAPASATAPAYAPVYAPPYDPSYASMPRGRGGRIVIGTRHEQQSDRGLWGAGLGLFLGGWVLDIVGTAIANAMSDRSSTDENNAQAWSVMPLGGPIAQLVVGAPHPALPLTFGIMQITGLVMFVMGLTSTHDAEVPVYALGDPSDPTTPRLAFEVTPRSDGGFASVTLSM